MSHYPMNIFDEEAILQEEVDTLIRIALLMEAGVTLDEMPAAYDLFFGKGKEKMPS